ncbi:hypothetical protein JXO52_12360 [bacterium]|nr:hypothetical protein [bacterium]
MKKTPLLIGIAVLLVIALAVIYAQDQDVKKEVKTEQTAVKTSGACGGCAAAAACHPSETVTTETAGTKQAAVKPAACGGCAAGKACQTAAAATTAKSCCPSKKETK